MHRTGFAKLPLHYGRAPSWLTVRMKKLANEIVTIILDEYGTDNFLRRISDPFWFQAFGCALGYDWHSSGVTTVVTGILKEAILPEEHGIAVCGGKGKISRQTPLEIENIGNRFGFSNGDIDALRYASKMSAKIDNAAIQAGYQLYQRARLKKVKARKSCKADRQTRKKGIMESERNGVNNPERTCQSFLQQL